MCEPITRNIGICSGGQSSVAQKHGRGVKVCAVTVLLIKLF